MRKVKTRLTGADNLTRLVHLKRWKPGEVEVDEKEDVDENLESEGLGNGGWVRKGLSPKTHQNLRRRNVSSSSFFALTCTRHFDALEGRVGGNKTN